MWEWNSATRHHLCPEDGERVYCRTSQRVCSSGQASRGPRVRDGRVSATVVHNRVERGERRGAKGGVSEDKMLEREVMVRTTLIYNHYLRSLCLPLSVLAFLWERLTNEGGTLPHARQKAQPGLWFEPQTWTGANLQHDSLQSTSLRSVYVWRRDGAFMCVLVFSPHQPHSPPLRSQMKTAGTDVTTAWWWFRPGCASTPTTRPPAVPHVPRVLSVPRGTDQPIADSPGVREVKD